MKIFYCFVFIFASTTGVVWAGDIIGHVRAQGKAGVESTMPTEKYGRRSLKFIERVDYDKLNGFVVYIDQPVPGVQTQTPKVARMVAHSNGEFIPHVLPVEKGTTIAWPNKDDIHHNAFSFSEAKSFNLGLYKDETKTVLFDKPGRVDVFCSIHKSMHCIVLVLENSFFSTIDRKGNYHIPDVPAGTYRIRAWHERLPSQLSTVEVPTNGSIRVDFTLSVDSLPQY